MPHILIITPNEPLLQHLVTAVTAWGYRAAGHQTCEIIKGELARDEYDAVILDPDAAGAWSLLEQLRGLGILPRTRVFLYAARESFAFRLRAYNLGIERFHVQSSDEEELQKEIETLLPPIGQVS